MGAGAQGRANGRSLQREGALSRAREGPQARTIPMNENEVTAAEARRTFSELLSRVASRGERAVIVPRNEKHFGRIPGLKVENWFLP
jgi:hypothetical protein